MGKTAGPVRRTPISSTYSASQHRSKLKVEAEERRCPHFFKPVPRGLPSFSVFFKAFAAAASAYSPKRKNEELLHQTKAIRVSNWTLYFLCSEERLPSFCFCLKARSSCTTGLAKR